MAATEAKFEAVQHLRIEAAMNPNRVVKPDHDSRLLLAGCDTYAWSADTAKAVWLASRTIPDTTRFSEQVCEQLIDKWWWFEWPLPVSMRWTPPPTVVTHELKALHLWGSIWQDRPMLMFEEFRQSDQGLQVTGMVGVEAGSTLAENSDETVVADPFTGRKKPASEASRLVPRFLLAACTWLEQRICSVSLSPIERHRRKQIARDFRIPPPPEVKVVQLRRLENPQRTPGESEPVDWSCRWIVNGHWRNQICAKGEHKLIYILPYVKGPEDKPLRVPAQTVYAVNR